MNSSNATVVSATSAAVTKKPLSPRLQKMHEEGLALLEKRMRSQEQWAELEEEYRRDTREHRGCANPDSIFTTHSDLPAPVRRAYLKTLLEPYLKR